MPAALPEPVKAALRRADAEIVRLRSLVERRDAADAAVDRALERLEGTIERFGGGEGNPYHKGKGPGGGQFTSGPGGGGGGEAGSSRPHGKHWARRQRRLKRHRALRKKLKARHAELKARHRAERKEQAKRHRAEKAGAKGEHRDKIDRWHAEDNAALRERHGKERGEFREEAREKLARSRERLERAKRQHAESRARAGPAPSTAKMSREMTPQEKGIAREVFGREVGDQHLANLSGMHEGDLRASAGRDADGRGWVMLEGKNDKYEVTRKVTRDPDGKVVLHAQEFKVKPEHQGQGIGTEVFGRMVHQAAGLGFDRIEARAAGGPGQGQNGYYTWPRFGYDAPLPGWMQHILPKEYHAATSLSQLMAMPGGAETWKAKGMGMDMQFDLKPGSHSRRVWDGYVKAKASK